MAETVLAKLAVEITAKATQFGSVLKQQESALNGFSKSVSNASNLIKGALGGVSFALIGQQIIDVTSEFQKFQAILTNTLGSSSAANKALENIRVFAKETPFEVSEVTAAYVRFANQGLNPSIDQMRKLGDVASSLGAGFEQTAEAFKDLAVGQTKRIEEIGISAQQANGKIQLSFKGVNLEVEKNAAGVQKAIDTYSQLNGVLGTSDAVSKTLGGRISNLKDSFSNFFLTIGESSSGPLFDIISTLGGIVDISSDVISSITNQSNAFGVYIRKIIDANLGLANLTVGVVKFLSSSAPLTVIELNAELTKLNKLRDEAIAKGDREEELFATKMIIELTNKYKLLKPAVEESNKTLEGTSAPVAQAIVSLDSLQAKLSELNKQFESTDVKDKKTLQNISDNILATQAQIEKLDALRKKQKEVNDEAKLSTFGKEQLKQAESGQLDPFGGVKQVGVPEIPTSFTANGSPFLNVLPSVKETEDRASVLIDSLKSVTDAQIAAGVSGKESIDQMLLAQDQQIAKQQLASQTAAEFGNIVGQALGSALGDQENFSQRMKKITKDLVGTFLARALAAAISTSFSSSGNPIIGAALAAAASGVVLGLFSGIDGGNSSGGRGSAAIPRAPASQSSKTFDRQIANDQVILIGGEFKIRQNDLVLSLDKATKERQRTANG